MNQQSSAEQDSYTIDDVYELGKELSNWGRWGEEDERGTLNCQRCQRSR